MRAGLPVVVEEVTRGHLKSSCKVISRVFCLVSLENLSIWEPDKWISSAGSGAQRLL